MAELIIQSGKHQGRRLRFSETMVTIGREEECQIRLASAEVSKQHCRLRDTEHGLIVQDLGSSNGTFVNDVRIKSETRLQPGDRLRVGPILFEVPAPSKASGTGAGRSRKAKALSEDDIASWLADETDHGEASSGDTAIIETTPAPAAAASTPPAAAPKTAASASAAAAAPREDRKKFRTVADEAADIIRRWWEVQRAEQNQV